jgi:general secretion pathway protein E/type IV pilus assembly protein PilB
VNRPARPGTEPAASAPSPSESGEIVRLLEEVVRRAVAGRSSDIHIEPKEDRLRIRYRIDGVLVEQPPLSTSVCAPLVSRIKVLAKMDIAERRNPQDGNFKVDLNNGQSVSIRASTFPCFDGEKCVLRLLASNSVLSLDALGMSGGQVKQMRRLMARTGGLVVVTGPTGAGKTSSLYSMLAEMDTTRNNVVTLEDPIEIQLPDLTQGQVLPKAGFTFETGLRAILRQDPDVILVGEMRDPETASIALQASLTGHLVLTTLHTNSTVETITRLIDIGLEPYVVANALAGIVAQRLVRLVCRKCADAYTLDRDVTDEVGFPLPLGSRLVRAKGCQECMFTGFRGRTGIYEILEVDDRLRGGIKRKVESPVIKGLLKEMGLPTLRRVGMQLALAGRTTAQEVLRVT